MANLTQLIGGIATALAVAQGNGYASETKYTQLQPQVLNDGSTFYADKVLCSRKQSDVGTLYILEVSCTDLDSGFVSKASCERQGLNKSLLEKKIDCIQEVGGKEYDFVNAFLKK